MAIEIERKFLIKPGAWTPRDAGTHMQQGYLSSQNGCTVRVRIESSEEGSSDPGRTLARLTVKGPTIGISRPEFEYAVPLADARFMLDELCEPPLIDKHRYLERFGRHTWEIDVFHGDNEGLIVAEVEMASEDDVLELPSWVGEEVSFDFRYSNASLRKAPFKSWTG
jgi:adenylate cyclase